MSGRSRPMPRSNAGASSRMADRGRGSGPLAKRQGTRTGSNLQGRSEELPFLEDGVRVTGSVKMGSFKYYNYKLDNVADITISVFTVSGDPDLYVAAPNLNQKPTLQSYSWNSAYVGGDTITIFSTDPNFSEGNFIVGIYGQSDAAFKVIVSAAATGGAKILVPLSSMCLQVIERSWQDPLIQELIPHVPTLSLKAIFDHFSKGGILTISVFETLMNCGLQDVVLKNNADVTAEWLEKLVDNKSLTTLVIQNCANIGDKAIAMLQGMKTRRLQAFELQNCFRLTGKGLSDVLLPHKKSLKFLNLSENKAISENELAFIGKCSMITHLNLSGCDGVTDSFIRVVKNLRNLENLKISFSGISGPGLADLSTLLGLKELDVSNAIVTKKEKAFEGILPLRNIVSLHIGHNRIGDREAQNIGQMIWLKELYLSDTTISSAAIKSLATIRSLETLDVSRTRVASCADFCEFPSLKHLNLMQTQLRTAESISGIESLVNLESLNIANTMLNNEGAGLVANVTSIKKLDISRTTVTDDGMTLLLRSLLNLEDLSILSLNVSSVSLAFLAGLYHLKKLSMSHSTVDDDEPDACVLLLHSVPSILHVELLDPRVTDLSIEALGDMRQLETLSLNRTRISDAALSRLKRSNPVLTDNLTLVGQWAGHQKPDSGSAGPEADKSSTGSGPKTRGVAAASGSQMKAKTKAISAFQAAGDERDARATRGGLRARVRGGGRGRGRGRGGRGGGGALSNVLKKTRSAPTQIAETLTGEPVMVELDANDEIKYYRMDIHKPADIVIYPNVQQGEAELFVAMCTMGDSSSRSCLPSKSEYTWFSSGELLTIYHTHPKYTLGKVIIGVAPAPSATKGCRCILSVNQRSTHVSSLASIAGLVVEEMVQSGIDQLKGDVNSRTLAKSMQGIWGNLGRTPMAVEIMMKSLIKRKAMTAARLAMLVNDGVQMKTFSLAGCDDALDDWLCVLETQEKISELDFSGCWQLNDSAISDYLELEWKHLFSLRLAGASRVGVKTLGALSTLVPTLTKLNLHKCVWITDENFHALCVLKNLTHLSVGYCGLMGGFLGDLAELVNLEELDLTNCIVTGRARRIKSLSKLKNLRVIDLKNNNGVLNESAFCLKSLTNVTSLNLSRTQMGGQGIAYLKNFGNLARLDLAKCQIADSALAYLTGLNGLRALVLRGTSVTDGCCQYLNQMGGLQELDLKHTKVSDSGVRQWFGLHNLQNLNLSMTLVGDGAVSSLAVTAPNIQKLELVQTTVTDSGVVALKSMKYLNHLAVSHISSDPETADRCAIIICSNLHGLTSLELLDSRLTAVGATRVVSLPSLKSLSLSQVRVTDSHLAKIKRKCPTLVDLNLVGRTGAESRRSYYWTKVAHAVHWIARTATTVRRGKSREWGKEVGAGTGAGAAQRGRGGAGRGLSAAARGSRGRGGAKRGMIRDPSGVSGNSVSAVVKKKDKEKEKEKEKKPISAAMQAALDMEAVAVSDFQHAKKMNKSRSKGNFYNDGSSSMSHSMSKSKSYSKKDDNDEPVAATTTPAAPAATPSSTTKHVKMADPPVQSSRPSAAPAATPTPAASKPETTVTESRASAIAGSKTVPPRRRVANANTSPTVDERSVDESPPSRRATDSASSEKVAQMAAEALLKESAAEASANSAMSAMVRRMAMQYLGGSLPGGAAVEPKIAPVVDQAVEKAGLPKLPLATPSAVQHSISSGAVSANAAAGVGVTRIGRDGSAQVQSTGNITPRNLTPMSASRSARQDDDDDAPVVRPTYRTRKRSTDEDADSAGTGLLSRPSWAERERQSGRYSSSRASVSPSGARTSVLLTGSGSGGGSGAASGSPIRSRPGAGVGSSFSLISGSVARSAGSEERRFGRRFGQ